jgi:hypothetical protein
MTSIPCDRMIVNILHEKANEHMQSETRKSELLQPKLFKKEQILVSDLKTQGAAQRTII